MRKILSKRGFTIVEVMVAFVIFAIMAGMVSMILAQVNVARQNNNDIQDEIENQKSVYYLKDQPKQYDSSKREGELSFNFDGSTSVNIDYSIGDPNADDDENLLALEYFIGNVNYDSAKQNSKDNKDEAGNNVGSVTTRLDSRVYGSTGIDTITLSIKRDSSYMGAGYRYAIKSMAIYDGLESQKRFAQYRLIFPSVILSYGYTDKSDNPTIFVSRFDTNTIDNMSIGYEVYSPYNRTLRISSKQSDNNITNDPAAAKPAYIYYYVVLEKPLEDIDPSLDLNKIFGYSSSEQKSSVTSSGAYEFTEYAEKVSDGKGGTSTANYPNIFGAFPKQQEETPSKSNP